MNVYLLAKGKSHAHRLTCMDCGEWGNSLSRHSSYRATQVKATCHEGWRAESSNGQEEWCLLGHVGRVRRFAEIFVEHDSSRDVDDQVGSDKGAEMRKKERHRSEEVQLHVGLAHSVGHTVNGSRRAPSA